MLFAACVLALMAFAAASSHSEAPGTAKGPRSDLSDVYFTKKENGAGPEDDTLLMIMNVSPLQRSDAGPNYSPLDPGFVYQYHLDFTGDAVEDLTFQFVVGHEFGNLNQGLTLTVNGVPTQHALVVTGGVSFNAAAANPLDPAAQENLNNVEHYRVRVMKGLNYDSFLLKGPFLTGPDGRSEFTKPVDYAGRKTFGDADDDVAYDTYVSNFIYDVNLPGCATPGKVFVGPRRESFSINLGAVFDLINIPGAPTENLPGGAEVFPGVDPRVIQDVKFNTLDCNTVVSFVLEMPQSCFISRDQVIGAWATVRELEHVQHHGHEYHVATKQVSRLGNPLINELLIGLPQKDKYNRDVPSRDAQFLPFFENPTIPAIIGLLFQGAGVIAPVGKRLDLVQTLLLGLPGINLPDAPSDSDSAPSESDLFGPDDPNDDDDASSSSSSSSSSDDDDDSSSSSDDDDDIPRAASGHVFADVLRLNTAVPFPEREGESPFGLIDLDAGGFPNGRRLGDDVVDIYLRVAMGFVCEPTAIIPAIKGAVEELGLALEGACADIQVDTASAILPYTDRSPCFATAFGEDFPYLNRPPPGNLMGECWRQENAAGDFGERDVALVEPQFNIPGGEGWPGCGAVWKNVLLQPSCQDP